MVEAELTFADVNKCNVSLGELKNIDPKFEACVCSKLGKASLTLDLVPTQQFTDMVKDAIRSKNPVDEFKKITERYGNFVSTEIVLGGRAYFEGFKDSDRNDELSKREYFKLIGGQQPDNLKDFDEESWIKSLRYFEYLECIEFRNPIGIFALLSEDLRKEVIRSVGKIVLYSNLEEFIYPLAEDEKPKVFELDIPSDIETIIQNKDADCNIFATVINNTSETNHDFFNCQIFCPLNGKPSLIIHCIPEISKRRGFDLKIEWKIIGYDKSFSSIRTDFHRVPLQLTSRLHKEVIQGGSSTHTPHCIAYKLPRKIVSSILINVSKKTTSSFKDETSIYTELVDWIQSLTNSIAQELSNNFNIPTETFVETSRAITNIVSSVGNGVWSAAGITPINAIKDIETNFPLYISDYFDQLSGWSREHASDQEKFRIGSNIARLKKLKNSSVPCPAKKPHYPGTAFSGIFVKISWSLPVANIYRSFNTSSDTLSSDEPSNGEVYRYFAFIDPYKQAITFDEDGSVTKKSYDFTDSSQLWRIDDFGNFYALYNKKYKQYLGRNLTGTNSKPNNNWHESAVYIVENNEKSTYSIGFTKNNRDYCEILKELTLVTIPLVAWRNSSGQFLNLDITHNGTLSFSNGEEHVNSIIPKSEQLFLFVPHPDFAKKAVVIGHNGKFLEFNPLTSNEKSFSCSYDLSNPARLPFVLFDYNQNIWPRSANYLASRIQQPLIATTEKTEMHESTEQGLHTIQSICELLTGDLEYLDGNPRKLEDTLKFSCKSSVVVYEACHSLFHTLQPQWYFDGFHNAFCYLCGLLILLSMDKIADLFVALTKEKLRDPRDFLSVVEEEFGDLLFMSYEGIDLKNLLSNKGSQDKSEIHALSLIFSGFYCDVLLDVFALERNPTIKSDTNTLMDVGTYLRRALIIATYVSSTQPQPTRTKFQEITTNLETVIGTLGRRLGVDLTSWSQIVRKHAISRELLIADSSDTISSIIASSSNTIGYDDTSTIRSSRTLFSCIKRKFMLLFKC